MRFLTRCGPQVYDVSAGIDNRLADFRAELDDRLVHLRLDLLFEHDFSTFENLLNVRTKLARLWIDNRELLLDAEREGVIFDAHRWAANVPQKPQPVILSASDGNDEARITSFVIFTLSILREFA